MIDVDGLFNWLVGGIPGASTAPQVVDRVASDLRAAGVPLCRAEGFVRTLHPHIAGRSFLWRPGEAVTILERTYAYLASAEFLASPVAKVFLTGTLERRRARDAAPPGEEAYAEWLAAEGLTEIVVVPLVFLSGQVHAITFATAEPSGFTEAHVTAIRRIAAPLARIAEILALSRTAANLLDTYVGRNAGERILAGKIKRGDVEPIDAVLWFSDLRGFTTLAGSLGAGATIRALNELFECQVATIERHGGEVLKFIGDGLLAIFPILGGGRSPAALCDSALAAADEAFHELATLNERRSARGEPELRFGLGLHVGDVAFGNIGGAGRLDFTCIGNAVNVAARLEGLASRLGRPLVMSEELARLSTRALMPLGEFELKGVANVQRVFAPASDVA